MDVLCQVYQIDFFTLKFIAVMQYKLTKKNFVMKVMALQIHLCIFFFYFFFLHAKLYKPRMAAIATLESLKADKRYLFVLILCEIN